MPVSKKDKPTTIEIVELEQGEAIFWILGLSPFYCNRVAEKAKRELLMPRGRMTGAQKAQNMKHDPEAEFRASPYLRKGPGETRIMMASTAPKKAIAQAAIDMPTTISRAQVNRLTYVVGEFIPIWGVPRLCMDVVRQADVNRTPDIRTRARIDRWASRISVRFIKPILNETGITNLLAASGVICGLGDWRQERGSAANGLYRIVSADDEELLRVTEEGGVEQQDWYLANPECANAETEDLLAWYREQVIARGKEKEAPAEKRQARRGKKSGGNGLEEATEVAS